MVYQYLLPAFIQHATRKGSLFGEGNVCGLKSAQIS